MRSNLASVTQTMPKAEKATSLPIALVGMTGAGKTTIARLLAQVIGRPFVDTDDLVVAAAGKSIASIFEEDGEPAFRDFEQQVIERAIVMDPAPVIAVAAGALQREANRAILEDGAYVIWIDVPLDVLLRRVTSRTFHRPLVARNPAEALAKMEVERRSNYEQTADLTVRHSGKPARELAVEISKELIH